VLRVRLIGRVMADVDGREIPEPASRRAWALLAWLALHPGQHSRAEVAARLWPDVLDASARQSMRSAVWALRQVLDELDPAALLTSRERIGLRADTTVDAGQFERLVQDGKLADAAALGTGELLPGIDDEWALVARDEHRRRLIGVLIELARTDEPAASVQWARRAVGLDPLSEDAVRQLMTSLLAADDRPAALAEYRKLADRLRRELRLAPSEPTWQLAERIRTELPPAPVVRTRPGLLPLVGRDDEVRALQAAWTAARGGHGGLAVISGEPGLGKTRLATQLADLADADDAVVATGAAPDLAGPPLAPWTEVGAALLDACGPLTDEPWLGALATLLPAHLPGHPGGDGPPDLAQARLFEAVVALLAEAARRRPVLVVLEDLHAADEASLALLAYAARRVPAHRILVLATFRARPARDHLLALEHASRQRGTLRAELRLTPLAGAAVAALARAVGDLDAPAVESIVATADGNPLLAVEAARALLAGDELPAGLRSTVRAAMARLPAGARELVHDLAVAGRDVPLDEVRARTGAPLADALPPAEEQGLLECVGDRVRFRHALLRDAVYAELPAADRVARHLAAAAYLAAEPARAAEAAAHLRAAGRLPEAGRLLLDAAEQARAVGALADATELLQAAVAARPDDAGAALALADVLSWRGRAVDAESAFAAALTLLERAGDPQALAEAHIRFAEWNYGPTCRPTVAVAACRQALAVLDGAGVDAPQLRAQALAVWAWCASIGGDLAEVDRALTALHDLIGDEPEDALLRCAIERTQCFRRLREGRFADAIEPGLRSAAAAELVHRPDLVYTALVNAAFGAAICGDLERALGLLDRAVAAVRGRGMLAIEALLLVDRAWVLTRQGRLAEADAATGFARGLADQLDAPDLAALVDAERGRVALRAGEHARAAELLATALARTGAAISRPLARLQRAEALARLGRADEAEQELTAVVTEPVRTGDWPDTLVARLSAVEGLIARERGDCELARHRWEAAAAGWRRRLSPAELGRQLGAVMIDLGRPIIGMVVPAEELAAIEADLAALASSPTVEV